MSFPLCLETKSVVVVVYEPTNRFSKFSGETSNAFFFPISIGALVAICGQIPSFEALAILDGSVATITTKFIFGVLGHDNLLFKGLSL
jgi:hypothetical protein